MPAEHHRLRYRRQPAAFLGLFALFLQAFLFSWHSHALPFSAPGQPPGLSAPSSGSPVLPALGDNCQICLSLNHLTAAPVIIAALPLPPPLGTAVRPGEAVHVGATPSAGFHARAPPARLT